VAWAASTTPARGIACDPANVATILAAIPICGEGCWTAKTCAQSTGLSMLVCQTCLEDMETNGLIGLCGPPSYNSWCRSDE